MTDEMLARYEANEVPHGVKVGDTIAVVDMPKDPAPMDRASIGKVVAIHKLFGENWQFEVEWEDGRTLRLIPPLDKFIVFRPGTTTAWEGDATSFASLHCDPCNPPCGCCNRTCGKHCCKESVSDDYIDLGEEEEEE